MSVDEDERRFYDEHREAWSDESVSDLIYEFGYTRGDLEDGAARDVLVDLLERKLRRAERRGAVKALRHAAGGMGPDTIIRSWWLSDRADKIDRGEADL